MNAKFDFVFTGIVHLWLWFVLQVGEHVGSRNQDECILYFMRLPVEEKFTDKTESLHHADDVIPFARSSNPVAYLMAFLAHVVDQKVAASAAKAALGMW